jgi:hypothetical protein
VKLNRLKTENASFPWRLDNSSLTYRVDYSEPLSKMVQRLIREHRELAPKLEEIRKVSDQNTKNAILLLADLRTKILRHAVEEEARIMRVIMKDAKSESADSVRIMQEHRWVSEFLEHRLGKLSNISPTESKAEIRKSLNGPQAALRRRGRGRISSRLKSS